MANEIIKLWEYFMNTPGVRAILVMYAVMAVIILIITVAVFVVILRQFFRIHKSHNRNKECRNKWRNFK